MRLELSPADLRYEHRECDLTQISFDKFESDVQRAISIVGGLTTYYCTSQGFCHVYPPENQKIPETTVEQSVIAPHLTDPELRRAVDLPPLTEPPEEIREDLTGDPSILDRPPTSLPEDLQDRR